jgi:threonine/homoserine/homoserine lactone efflux protein
VVILATVTRDNFLRRPRLFQRLRQGSGVFMIGLGASLLLARRPAAS